MARVGRFATCNVSMPSPGAEDCGAGVGAGGFFSRGAALRGRRVVSSRGRLPTHDAATASTADFLCRFAGGSAGAHSGIASQSGISSSESSDIAPRVLQGWLLQVAALFTEPVQQRTDGGRLADCCGLTVGSLRTDFDDQSSRTAVLLRLKFASALQDAS